MLQREEDESREEVLKVVRGKAFRGKGSVMKAVSKEKKDLESSDGSSSQEEGFLEKVRASLLLFFMLLSF